MAEKRDTEERQEQIASAALRLVATQGVKALTVDRLARLVGLVPSALYRHFPGKGAILDAVMALMKRRFMENVRRAKEGASDPLEALHQLLLKQIALAMEFQAIPKIFFSDALYNEATERRTAIYGMIQVLLSEVEELIRSGQEQGLVRKDINPQEAATAFLGVFQSAIFLWHLSGNAIDLVGRVDASWRIYSEGIRGK